MAKLLDADADAEAGAEFEVMKIVYLGPAVEFLVRQGDGDLWRLTGDVDTTRTVVFSAVAVGLPEPATGWLALAALAVPAWRRLRARRTVGAIATEVDC